MEELDISISKEMEENCHKESWWHIDQDLTVLCFCEDWLVVISKCQMELMDISEVIRPWYLNSYGAMCGMWASVNKKKLSDVQKEAG